MEKRRKRLLNIINVNNYKKRLPKVNFKGKKNIHRWKDRQPTFWIHRTPKNRKERNKSKLEHYSTWRSGDKSIYYYCTVYSSKTVEEMTILH